MRHTGAVQCRRDPRTRVRRTEGDLDRIISSPELGVPGRPLNHLGDGLESKKGYYTPVGRGKRTSSSDFGCVGRVWMFTSVQPI